jgi:hypothetical protein
MVALASSSCLLDRLAAISLASSSSALVAPHGDSLREDLTGQGDEPLALGDEVGSQLTSTRVPTPLPAWAATRPLLAERPSRLVTPLRPLMRRFSVP